MHRNGSFPTCVIQSESLHVYLVIFCHDTSFIVTSCQETITHEMTLLLTVVRRDVSTC